jgi:hypothetical protein
MEAQFPVAVLPQYVATGDESGVLGVVASL